MKDEGFSIADCRLACSQGMTFRAIENRKSKIDHSPRFRRKALAMIPGAAASLGRNLAWIGVRAVHVLVFLLPALLVVTVGLRAGGHPDLFLLLSGAFQIVLLACFGFLIQRRRFAISRHGDHPSLRGRIGLPGVAHPFPAHGRERDGGLVCSPGFCHAGDRCARDLRATGAGRLRGVGDQACSATGEAISEPAELAGKTERLPYAPRSQGAA